MDDAKSPSSRSSQPDALGRTEGFSDRVLMLAQNVGGIMELAKRSNLSHQVVRKYVRGVSDPSRERLVALARAGNVQLEWLATGEGEMAAQGVTDQAAGADGGGQRQVLSAGRLPVALICLSGIRPEIEVPAADEPAPLYLDSQQLLKLPGVQADSLAVHIMRGDSMAPTIPAGTPVVVDTSTEGKRPADDVFVFCIEERILLKRLQWLPGRQLRICSDNPAYTTYEIDLAAGTPAPYRLIGRALCVLRLL